MVWWCEGVFIVVKKMLIELEADAEFSVNYRPNTLHMASVQRG